MCLALCFQMPLACFLSSKTLPMDLSKSKRKASARGWSFAPIFFHKFHPKTDLESVHAQHQILWLLLLFTVVLTTSRSANDWQDLHLEQLQLYSFSDQKRIENQWKSNTVRKPNAVCQRTQFLDRFWAPKRIQTDSNLHPKSHKNGDKKLRKKPIFQMQALAEEPDFRPQTWFLRVSYI